MRADQGIVLYGAGNRCATLIEILEDSKFNILSVIDADERKLGNIISGYRVENINELKGYCKDSWCITIADWNIYCKVKKEIIYKFGLKEEKCIQFDALILECMKSERYIQQMIKGKAGLTETRLSGLKITDKLCFGLIGGLGLGGIEERVKQLCENMIRNGREDVFILSNAGDQRSDISDTLQSHVLRVEIDHNKRATIENIIQFLLGQAPCTVVTNHPDEFWLAASIMKGIEPGLIKLITIVSGSHEYLYDSYTGSPVHSDIYLGVSMDIVEEIKKRGIENVKLMTVPFPCDEVLERSWSVSSATPIHIGYAGRLDGFQGSQKRMDLLVEIFSELAWRGIKYEAELAGDGPAFTEMQRRLQDKGVLKYVQFLGRIPKQDIRKFWLKQDIGVNMADYEGRSISIAEMMGSGCVPVVTDTSGVRDDIVDGVNGYIVSVGDYKAAVDRIEHLYHHRELLSRMGEKAHVKIWPKSRMDKHLEFWEEMLKEMN